MPSYFFFLVHQGGAGGGKIRSLGVFFFSPTKRAVREVRVQAAREVHTRTCAQFFVSSRAHPHAPLLQWFGEVRAPAPPLSPAHTGGAGSQQAHNSRAIFLPPRAHTPALQARRYTYYFVQPSTPHHAKKVFSHYARVQHFGVQDTLSPFIHTPTPCAYTREGQKKRKKKDANQKKVQACF